MHPYPVNSIDFFLFLSSSCLGFAEVCVVTICSFMFN